VLRSPQSLFLGLSVNLLRLDVVARSRTRSLRVAVVVFVVIIVIVIFAVVFLFIILWFLSKEEIGSYPPISMA
jgi:heme/copper-type cytochrome/quinol oxidase subunit 2